MKKFWSNLPYLITLLAISISFVAATAFFTWKLALVEGAVILLCVLFVIARRNFLDRSVQRAVEQVIGSLDFSQKDMLEHFPLPMLVADANDSILWYNELFNSRILGDGPLLDDDATLFTDGTALKELPDLGSISTGYNDRQYTVYSGMVRSASKQICVLYFVDDTRLKKIEQEYARSRCAVLFLSVDNLEEIAQDFKDSDRAALTGGVEKIIENWMSQYPCLMTKTGNGRYLVVVQEQNLSSMIERRFNLLDETRAYTYGEITGVTLSIGVGRGDSLRECEDSAQQALDMALGRGGDQAAVQHKGQFTFYGGVSMGVEKRTKVQTRITASAVKELIDASENVFIMGHRFADLDALGAAVGLQSIARHRKKEAYIVMARDKSLATPLIERMDAQQRGDRVIAPERAMELLTKKSLLIIVDTHRPDFVEYPPLYQKATTVVVIDHHRRTVDYIDNAVIFHHEPYASSASEMVTELLPYMSHKPVIDRLEAEALMAGIMLDTRNFILRTGVRTFEAAAYLRSRGADTVSVKQLFSDSMENYRLRNTVINNTDIYRSCAIALSEADTPDIRVVSSQAADELLNISGVTASFVLFKADHVVNVSARSMGAINVQVLMEALGGGGHQTMAAAQLADITVSDARVRLLEVIDTYYDSFHFTNQKTEEQS